MEFRNYAAQETTALVGRLLASQSEASLQQLQTLRAALDVAARTMETATEPTPEVEAQVQQLVRKLNEAASRAVQRIREDARAALDAVQRDLDAHRAENEELTTALARAQTLAEGLEAELQQETQRADRVEGDLAAATEAHTQAEAARLLAEAACQQQADATAVAGHELRQVRATLDAALADVTRLDTQLHAVSLEKGELVENLGAARQDLEAAQVQLESLAELLQASSARVQTLEGSLADRDEQIRQLGDRIDALDLAEAHARDLIAAREQDIATARAENSRVRGEVARLASLLEASAIGIDELARATSVSELFAALVEQFATQFSRVALFRVKGNRLEGEHQIGFDLTTDVRKLVIPLNVDSLLTRAASSGAIESFTDTEIADDSWLAPFGAASAAVLAVPIVLQGDTLAIVYAEGSDQPESDADLTQKSNIGFATLLVRHTVALLALFTQELKTLSELRGYASVLLEQAEQMYGADAEARRPGDELRHRLKDIIDCARQLYAQRATMEGIGAAALLDEQIAAIIDGQATPFARDLAWVAGRSDGTRAVSEPHRAAEAS